MCDKTGGKIDAVYHACLDKWDEVRFGLDVEDAAAILIDVVTRLQDKIDRDEQHQCAINAQRQRDEMLSLEITRTADMKKQLEAPGVDLEASLAQLDAKMKFGR